MIKSRAYELNKVSINFSKNDIKMMPFMLDTLDGVPKHFLQIVETMVQNLPIRQGVAYLTIDGKTVEKSVTHRRGGKHIDGNYIPIVSSKNDGGWNNGGWKVGQSGRELSSDHHKISYCNPENGGMLIVSNYPACMGWIGEFDGEANIGGDSAHIQTNDGFMLKPNVCYYGSSQFVHESLPLDETVDRIMIRVTLGLDYPMLTKVENKLIFIEQ